MRIDFIWSTYLYKLNLLFKLKYYEMDENTETHIHVYTWTLPLTHTYQVFLN